MFIENVFYSPMELINYTEIMCVCVCVCVPYILVTLSFYKNFIVV